MPLNKYDKFLRNDFMPDVTTVIMRENKRLEKMIGYSDYYKFYQDHYAGITSYAVTERIYQYLIFRSLAGSYRMILEDYSYPNNSSRMDITLFKTRPKADQTIGDIGIEIKLGQINIDGVYSAKSIADFKADFVKIKKAKHENKYLLQIVETECNKYINIDSLQGQILLSLGGKAIKTYKPTIIYTRKFKTLKSREERSNIWILFWKVGRLEGLISPFYKNHYTLK